METTGPPLTVSGAAKALNISTRLTYRLVAEGRIKALHFGAAIRVPRDELARVLREGLRPAGRK